MHNIVQNLIDFLRGKKKLKLKLENNPIYSWKISTQKQIKRIKKKVKNKEKIKVAFLVMYTTSIQFTEIFEKMLNSDIFEPYLIANPDFSRSQEHLLFNYNRTVNELVAKYGSERVLLGYDIENDIYKDFSNDFDLMFTNNPYDNMAQDYYKVSYWAKKEKLLLYISYFYMGRCYITIENLKLPTFNMFWRIFVENNYVKTLAKKYQGLSGKNMIVTGYSKLDSLARFEDIGRKRKRIIIAPHHSINMDFLAGFLEYSDTLLELPKRYPNIDFVFRPHPLLIQNLKKEEFWGEKKTEEYINNLLSNKNVMYSTQGDYFELFQNSDAIFHDCGSFTSEYMCTGKPCAFYIRKKMNIKKIFTDFGRKHLNLHYKCRSAKDIYNFIEQIVIAENDFMKNKRMKFVNKEILLNFPNVSQKIFDIIIKELT